MILRSDTSGEAGFTLIEVLVVIVILGLTAALVLARGPSRSAGLEARAAATEVAQTLRLGRSQAIATDRPTAVMLDVSTHWLMLNGAARGVLPAALPVAALMADGSRPRRAIFGFASDGSATGGTVVLGNPGQRILVTVNWLTGRVDVVNAR
jgi:general secretion pathway protein H